MFNFAYYYICFNIFKIKPQRLIKMQFFQLERVLSEAAVHKIPTLIPDREYTLV